MRDEKRELKMDYAVEPREPSPLPPSEAAVLPEAEVIRRAKHGDEAAFEQIYRQHSGRVHALCFRMIGNREEAAELTQEAFLQLFRKLHTFRGASALSTWLHRLTVNVVLMSLRRKRPVAISLEGAQEDNESGGPRFEIGSLDPVLKGAVDRLNLRRAIAQLPPGYKQVFILHDVYGYEHREIAAILRCSVGNTKSQVHKARMRLRELLQGHPVTGRKRRAPPAGRPRTSFQAQLNALRYKARLLPV